MAKHDTRPFGQALRAFRLRAKKSQGDLAKHLGLSVPYISDIERGQRAPLTYDNLRKAAAFLDADVFALTLARARWHGVVEVPLTGNWGQDANAVTLALAAIALLEAKEAPHV